MAAKFSFINIAKANAEIDRLSAELATVTARNAELEAANVDNSQSAEAVSEVLKAEIATEKARHADACVKMQEQAAEISKLQAALTAKEDEVAKRAASAAVKIVASQGVPAPLPAEPPKPMTYTEQCLAANAAAKAAAGKIS